MRMRITDLAYQLFEKKWPLCLIYVPSGAEGSAPEQHAKSPTESNFNLPLVFSGSNESPNQTLHNALTSRTNFLRKGGLIDQFMSRRVPK